MRALVTGGCGFIGSHLVDRLLAGGWGVDVVDDLSSGRMANLADARADRSHDLTIHRLDIRASDLAEVVLRRPPDVIFHLATPGEVGSTELASAIVAGTANVLDAAVGAGVGKIVVALSAELYGDVPPRELPIKDTRLPSPRTARGLAGRAVLGYLDAYRAEHALEFCALPLADVYGPRRIDGSVAEFSRALLAGDPGRVPSQVTRDFVAVDDAVDAFARAGERGTGLLVNIGTGIETTLDGLHELIASAVGVTAAPTRVPAPDGPLRLALDPRRAEIYLGWRSFTPLGEGVSAVLRWWSEQARTPT
jgi:UDP-glucose 4-epimerase